MTAQLHFTETVEQNYLEMMTMSHCCDLSVSRVLVLWVSEAQKH